MSLLKLLVSFAVLFSLTLYCHVPLCRQHQSFIHLFFLILGCDRVYKQKFGYLKSPGWPDIYPHSIDCTTILEAPQNHSISLFFNAFDLESQSTCQFDYLEVKSFCTHACRGQ